MKNKIGLILSLCLLLVVSGITIYKYTDIQRQLVVAEEKSVAYNTQQQSSENIIPESEVQKYKDVTGIDVSRVATDDKKVEDFLKYILTWKNYSEYKQKRDSVINDYHVPEDGHFLTTFFPEIKVVKDKAGNEYNALDDGMDKLNLSFGSMKSKVIDIKDDVYSYCTFVQITTDTSYKSSTGEQQSIAGTGSCIVLYDVDANGVISNLDAYTVAN